MNNTEEENGCTIVYPYGSFVETINLEYVS